MAEELITGPNRGQPGRQSIAVSSTSDALVLRRAAASMAGALRFDDREIDEISIVAKELAGNLIKYARAGLLVLTPLDDGLQRGIQIESFDEGPGIPDVEEVMADGFSTSGSLGYGLGTANRLMDEFDIASRRGSGGGTYIVCRKWKRTQDTPVKPCPFDIGVATRCHPKMALNGDAFVVKKWEDSILVALIDGLGHGQFAHLAAGRARQYVQDHFDAPLKDIFRNTGRACKATRGVVMAIARFDRGRNVLTFASIGNIEARVLGSPEPMSFIVRRGIVGVNTSNPAVTEHRWEPSYLMILHTDGLSVHWKWEDFPDITYEKAEIVSQRMLRRFAKDHDDATVVVVKGR
jgi:anti-sigma regulatory factor (Ser/Thr protein kinase)/serine/threonine protein phosphatase PrpC